MSSPPDEAKVYDLVARRFLAVFFPAARFENTTVVTEVRGGDVPEQGGGWCSRRGGARCTRTGSGGKKEKEPPVLPPIEVGQEWRVAKVGVKEGETKPPPRYSESALLGAMETAGKFVEDEELRQAMKESGLGTPATRAAIIERLIKVGYVEREKKALVPTSKGRALISLLGRARSPLPELTGQWERRLAEMERGAEEAPGLHGRHRQLYYLARRGGARDGGGEAGLPQPRAARGLPQVRLSSRRDAESVRMLRLEDERL